MEKLIAFYQEARESIKRGVGMSTLVINRLRGTFAHCAVKALHTATAARKCWKTSPSWLAARRSSEATTAICINATINL